MENRHKTAPWFARPMVPAQIERRRLGGLEVQWARYEPGERMPPHRDPATRLSVVVQGGLEETVGRSVEMGPGSVLLKGPECLHATRFGDRGAVIVSIGVALDDLPPAMGPGCWEPRTRGPSTRFGLRLLEDVAVGNPAGDSLQELLAGLEAGGAVESDGGGSWPERLRERIEDEPFDLPSVAELAGELGLHPVYLARRFRAHSGLSITDYRRRCRVRRVLDALANRPDFELASLALEAGYYDQSHLGRDLRLELHRSPARLRSLLPRLGSNLPRADASRPGTMIP